MNKPPITAAPVDRRSPRAPRAGQPGGLYVVVTELTRPIEVPVGRLGSIHFAPGLYGYVGSAARGLEARIRRHFAPASAKRMHWHIDYVLARAPATAAVLFTGPSGLHAECRLNRAMEELAAVDEPAPGFGASDCRCITHLHMLSGGNDTGVESAEALLDLVAASGSRVLRMSDVCIVLPEAFSRAWPGSVD